MEKLFTSLETIKSNQDFHFTKNWPYETALEEQLSVYDQVASGKCKFRVLSGEHRPVYTLGNSLKDKPVTKSNVPFVETDRGGQLMYHGPGQLTVYPIFKLRDSFSGPREYSKFIFDTAIEQIKRKYKLELKCQHNGLWLEGKKVGFLGLRIKNGIAYHGLSLNYSADLTAFKQHSPCDISGDQAGNLFSSSELLEFNLEEEAFDLSKAIALKLTI